MESRSFLPLDTDAEAYDVQNTAYRRMGAIGRTAVMFRLTEMARKNAVSGIRERHPDYDEEQLLMAFSRLRLGDELARRLWPGRELPEP